MSEDKLQPAIGIRSTCEPEEKISLEEWRKFIKTFGVENKTQSNELDLRQKIDSDKDRKEESNSIA